MNEKSTRSYWSRILVLGIITLIAFAAPCRARVAGTAQPKRATPKIAKAASKPRAVFNPDHELLLRLEENQRALQRELQSLSAASERRTDQANHGMLSLADQFRQFATQKDADYAQLSTAVQSARRLLRLELILLLLLCGALAFVGLQLRKSGFMPFERRLRPTRPEPADAGIEARWKVGL